MGIFLAHIAIGSDPTLHRRDRVGAAAGAHTVCPVPLRAAVNAFARARQTDRRPLISRTDPRQTSLCHLSARSDGKAWVIPSLAVGAKAERESLCWGGWGLDGGRTETPEKSVFLGQKHPKQSFFRPFFWLNFSGERAFSRKQIKESSEIRTDR